MKPKVTVIIPFYNAANTLERALESIVLQSLTNFECLLINNNSTDESCEIVKKTVRNDSRFRLLNETKQGVMHASNLGSRHAQADYIARMDADDYSMPKRLELQAEFLDSNPEYGVIASKVEHIPYSIANRGFERYVNWVNSVLSYNEILKNQYIESPIVNPSAMWRKSVALEHGMYLEGGFPEDYEMWLRWLSKGVKIKKLDDVLLQWYDSKTRLTRTHDIYSDDAFFRIKSRYLANWLKLHNPLHPKVVLWGASRISRKRGRILEDFGIEISGYIDINKDRQLNKDVIYYTHIPPPKEVFVLVYIKQANLKIEIQKFLHKKGFIEGVNYLLVS